MSGAAAETERELCPRCGAELDWRHQTWQCLRCRFKLGCCEGEAQTDGAAVDRRPVRL